ncbi:MarR family transcriptional regulator [Amycolatopsis acidiphila]|uniref:MarR family transcriptional regulator n=1 Tax=Amycolatopsis acidiphila TaxID=715473 RepID=A0A558AP88_9PSEU|nr:MarR family transcriptional regulator [Amycolatopsis acidiphila]TVT26083.1 MarR family transcriptional regulator [Amycolatopsis acidiphila]UIJ63191.1 MarR family transcriptional regulator [Amycolatopsis acidiphila]GHG74250.1 transcriptional regulator [Amycolatopsis acidiphila]
MSTRRTAASSAADDVDAVTDAVLTASRLLVAVSARSIAAVDESITIPQFRLLVVLGSRGPVKLTALAEFLAVNPSTATRMVDRLVAAELVSREANPASRRELVVSLTGTGAAVVREVTQRRRKEISRIVGRMAPTTRRGMVRALAAFTDAGDEPGIADQGDLWL